MEAKKKSQLFRALKSGIEKMTVNPKEDDQSDSAKQDSLFFDNPDNQGLPQVNTD